MVGMSSVETDTKMAIVIKPIMVEELIKERLNMQSNNSLDMVDERGWEEVYIFSVLFLPRKCLVRNEDVK
jgi:hypothetical protein